MNNVLHDIGERLKKYRKEKSLRRVKLQRSLRCH